jgi:hypothetical protein
MRRHAPRHAKQRKLPDTEPFELIMTDRTYTVYHVHIEDRPNPSWSFLTREEAEEKAAQMREHVKQHMTSEAGRNTKYTITETQVTTDFHVPRDWQPRDLYFQEISEHATEGRPGSWKVQDIKVLRKIGYGETSPVVGEYHRNYHGRPPFEVFRQFGLDGCEKHYALIATHYESTDVMDLETGQIIAMEDPNGPDYGFCPVGFYVPDWADLHDPKSCFPGSWYWEEQWDRWPDGSLGFVWGCHWGDDNGWKVQALDLSQVSKGIVKRDERFGYQYLHSLRNVKPEDFINVSTGEGGRGPTVTFAVPKQFDLETGEAQTTYEDWHKLKDESKS